MQGLLWRDTNPSESDTHKGLQVDVKKPPTHNWMHFTALKPELTRSRGVVVDHGSCQQSVLCAMQLLAFVTPRSRKNSFKCYTCKLCAAVALSFPYAGTIFISREAR